MPAGVVRVDADFVLKDGWGSGRIESRLVLTVPQVVRGSSLLGAADGAAGAKTFSQ